MTKRIKAKIDGHKKEYLFECYENTEPIEVGDKYLYLIGNVALVKKCRYESTIFEINKSSIDCENSFKIKYTDYQE